MHFREGQLLAGKYRIERVLGQGGMGVVVAAHHVDLDEQVAIKFLLPRAMSNLDALARFEREARAVVKIRSEHVSRVVDVGRLESGEPYMVMELLRGMDLAELLAKNGPLSVSDTADYLLQAGEAIAEAHALGIVHRDLKPQNLYLTHRADGSACVKVLDFGISKMNVDGQEQALTATSVILGSPLYMAPEQLLSARDTDLRVDIWALGVICFQLLTGKTPFLGENLPQLLMAINAASPLPLHSLRADVPPALEALIFRCLEKDRLRRPASMAEVARELVRFAPASAAISAERIARLVASAGGSGRAQRPLSPANAASLLTISHTLVEERPVGNEATIDGLAGTQRPRSTRRQASLGAVGVVVLLAVALAIWRTWHHEDGAARSTPALSASPSSWSVVGALPASDAGSTLPLAPGLASAPSTPASSVPPLSAVAPPQALTRAATSSAASGIAPARQRASTVPAVDCEIPYVFDARGNKVFKSACL